MIGLLLILKWEIHALMSANKNFSDRLENCSNNLDSIKTNRVKNWQKNQIVNKLRA
jgi:hypothetical protein